MSKFARDKIQAILNPFSKKLDMVRIFNPNRIITAELNADASPRVVWSTVSNSWIPDGPTIITDDDGNVVTT